jgi:MFS family permease
VAPTPFTVRGGVLNHPVLRAILAAELISALGIQMSFLALAWLVLDTTGSATHMGLVIATEALPIALLGVPSALVVQRIGARRTLMYANLGRAPLLASIPLLDLAGWLRFPALLVIAFAIGVFAAPYLSAQRLLLPEAFDEDEQRVMQGNAMIEGVARIGTLLGPAIAGVVITGLGAQTMWVNAATFVTAYLIQRRWLPRRPPGVAPVPSRGGILAGARYVLTNPQLRRITASATLFGLFFPPLLASLPVLTRMRYDDDPVVAGLLYAAWGGGALIGTLLVLPAAKRFPPVQLGAIGAVGLAIPLWLLVNDLSRWQFMLVLLVSGVFTPILNAPVFTLIMLLAPVELRAKVITFVLSMNLLTGPLAYALTGPALDRWGLTVVYAFVAIGVSLASAILVTLAFARSNDEATDEPDAVPEAKPVVAVRDST